MKQELQEVFKTLFLPEIEKIGKDIEGIKGRLSEMSNRLTDLNSHIIRLDNRIDALSMKVEQQEHDLTEKIEKLRQDLTEKIEKQGQDLSEMSNIQRQELLQQIMLIANRIDATNERLDKLYIVVVKREEYNELKMEVRKLRDDLDALIRKVG